METVSFFPYLISGALVLTLYLGIPLLIGYAIFMIARNSKTSKQLLEEILNQQKETNQLLKEFVVSKQE